MTQSSNHVDPIRGPGSECTARERIDALLDEALKETFPASDSSAIGSGIAVIKREYREQQVIEQTNVGTSSKIAGRPALPQRADRPTS